MQLSQENGYFCYLTIGNWASWICTCVASSLSVLLALYLLSQFCKMRGSHNNQTAFVYSNMLIWWLTFIGTTVYSMCLFKLNEDQESQYTDQQMSRFSKYGFVVDWVNGFCIQLLLLYVPYHWCKGICVLFNVGINRNTSTRGSQVFLSKPYEGPQTKVLPFLKFYITFRLTWLALPVLFLILNQYLQVLFLVQIGCLLLDCVVITVSLVTGMISLKTSQELIDMLDQDQIKRMFNQYLIIILASTIRFALDILAFQHNLENSIVKPQCPVDKGTEQPASAQGVIFTVLIIILAHYFPIFIISRIYSLDEKPEEICKSLIITTTTQGLLPAQ